MIFAVYIAFVTNIIATCCCIYRGHNGWAIAFFIFAIMTLPTIESRRRK